MEFNNYIMQAVTAIGIGAAIVLSFYVLRFVLPVLFRIARFLIKARLVLLIAILIVSGISLLGASLIAFLRHEPVPLTIVGFALLFVVIGAGGLTPFIENEFYEREELFERTSGDVPSLEQGRDRV